MTQKSFPITAEFVATANITPEQYVQTYKYSTDSSDALDAFWAERAEQIDWIKTHQD